MPKLVRSKARAKCVSKLKPLTGSTQVTEFPLMMSWVADCVISVGPQEPPCGIERATACVRPP